MDQNTGHLETQWHDGSCSGLENKLKRLTKNKFMTRIKTTTDLTEKILAPLVKYCSDNRGALTKVTELYNKGLTEKVRITSIQRWLNSNGSKKDGSRFRNVQPSGGALLRLCEVWILVRGNDCESKPQPTINCIVNGHQPAREGFS